MESEWRRKHCGPLRRLHQHRRTESNVPGRSVPRNGIGEPVQLFAAQWQLRFLRSGCGEAEHSESNVRCREIYAGLHTRQHWQRKPEFRYESFRADDFHGNKWEDDRLGNATLGLI